jgi:N-acetylmuramoyl-L-alanine amidase
MNLTWLSAEMRAAIEAMTETQRVALVLAGEARSEPIEGIVAIANVMRNRVTTDLNHDGKPDWWGEGFSDVVTRPKQFSCLFPAGGEKNYRIVLKLARQFAEGKPVTDPRILQCIGVANLLLTPPGYLVDNTLGANHYAVSTLTPKWAEGKQPVARKGGHYFWKL